MTVGVLQAVSVIVALTLTLTMSPFVEALEGGEWAKPGEFPHAVQLSSSETGKVFCGGSIFSPNVVITAAHCVYPYWMDLLNSDTSLGHALVTAGTLENQSGCKESGDGSDEMAQVRTVDRYVIHPYFNTSSRENNIALVIFDKPLNYTDKVKAIQLPPPNATYSRGTVIGWSYTDGRNLSSLFLKKSELVFKDRNSCNSDSLMMREPKDRKVTDLDLCAKWTKENSPCKMGRGSSVICQVSNTTTSLHNNRTSNSSLPPTICGIVSFGKGHCAESGTIGVFVDVSKYLDWIQKEAEMNVEEVKKIKMKERIIFLTSLVIIWIVIVILVVVLVVMIVCKIKKMYASRVTAERQVELQPCYSYSYAGGARCAVSVRA